MNMHNTQLLAEKGNEKALCHIGSESFQKMAVRQMITLEVQHSIPPTLGRLALGNGWPALEKRTVVGILEEVSRLEMINGCPIFIILYLELESPGFSLEDLVGTCVGWGQRLLPSFIRQLFEVEAPWDKAYAVSGEGVGDIVGFARNMLQFAVELGDR